MSRYHVQLVCDVHLGEHVCRWVHDCEIRVAAHDDPHAGNRVGPGNITRRDATGDRAISATLPGCNDGPRHPSYRFPLRVRPSNLLRSFQQTDAVRA